MECDRMSELTILVVKDDIIGLEPLKNILELACDNVILAANGLEALAKLETIQPDMILSDLEMPVMNGMEFYSRVKAQKNLRHIPFIFFPVPDKQKKASR
jgi:CheY-like chemotaxis protein